MKIGFFEITQPDEIKYFTDNLTGVEMSFFPHPINHQNLDTAKDFDLISTFVNCKVDSVTLDSLTKLRGVFARSTGIDVIDTAYAKQKGIKVFNVPSYGSHTVAEFAFALILALLRNVPQAVERTKVDGKFYFEGLRGTDLCDKTLGVIGTGRIGENVVKIGLGFGMKILACDINKREDLSKLENFKYVTLEEVLKNSDVITLHAPYTKENHHMINESNIKMIKKSAFIINTARGGLIDTHVLFNALKNKDIGGAALDVLEQEQGLKEEAELLSRKDVTTDELIDVLEDKLLLDLPNVIVTPHLAFYTKEAEESILNTVVQNIKGYLSGTNVNLVNP